jgi:nucleoside-diphosphate-sugar epimerase
VNVVDGVFHTASPVVVVGSGGGKDDVDVQATLVEPIVKGAANVLRSCARAAVPARRVVFTSSCSCVRYCHAATLNESHWSDADYCKSHNVRTNVTVTDSGRVYYY